MENARRHLLAAGLVLAVACGADLPDGPVDEPASGGPVEPTPSPPAPSPTPAARVQVEFKLDARLTGGVYMGERWVSPAVFTSSLEQGFVEARARCLDGSGRVTDEPPAWSAAPAEVAAVELERGAHTRLFVHGPGEGALTASCGDEPLRFALRAAVDRGRLVVTLTR